MMPLEKGDLREVLIDAHAHFFFLKDQKALRVKLWQILPDAIVVEMPVGAPMRKTMLGYIPTLDGTSVYEIEGTVSTERLADQMPNTIRIEINPSSVRKINRRLYPRVSFTPPLPAEAEEEGRKEKLPIRILNFSAGGLRIETDTPLKPEKSYTFRFKIETEDTIHDLKLAGQMVYELPAKSGHLYGIQFSPSQEMKKADELPVEELDHIVDLMNLVNQLLIRGS